MGLVSRIKKFYRESMRVIRVTKKPDKEEFKLIAKVSAAWIALIGFTGFILFVLEEFTNTLIMTLIAITAIIIIMFIKRD